MDKLRQAWRRHRIRLGKIHASMDEYADALGALDRLQGHVTDHDVARVGYYEILVAAAAVVLDAESRREASLPFLLAASGAVTR